MSDISLSIDGIDAVLRNMDMFKDKIDQYLSAAGQEAAQKILRVKGLKLYPGETAGNSPGRTRTITYKDGKTRSVRMGYYIRGRGMQEPVKGGGYKDLANSERLGTQWTIERQGYNTLIGNRASYAGWVHGDGQADYMGRIGWRKLFEVADENLELITEIYQKWVYKLIEDTGME